MLGEWCSEGEKLGQDGKPERTASNDDMRRPSCLTLQPPLFVQHYGHGGASDITAPGGGYIDNAHEMTPYVRLSVRLNMGRLVKGFAMERLVDQWPDEAAGDSY
jgi:hypothetical protein